MGQAFTWWLEKRSLKRLKKLRKRLTKILSRIRAEMKDVDDRIRWRTK